MANKFQSVTHVDLDGLLLDTEPINEKVFQEIVEKYGKKLTQEVRLKILGVPERKSFKICIVDLQLDVSIEDFTRDFHELAQEKLANVELMPGAERLVRHLHANNVPICVATSSSEDSMSIKSAKHVELFKLFHHIIHGTDPELTHGKPSPDIFLVAARHFNPQADPKNCLIFEDSPNGVQGGLSAGMQVTMVPANFISQEQKSKATIAIKSLEDFKPEIFGLPPF